MLHPLELSLLLMLLTQMMSCQNQSDSVSSKLSNNFDDTPPIYYRMPATISSIDTSAAWNHDGRKILLTGTVYRSDGITPAANILIYYYHTDATGRYRPLENEERSMPYNKLGQTHGYIRGWAKTSLNGKYSIFTLMPGSYLGGGKPAHVHAYIKEPSLDDPYYIDDFVFDNDPLLNTNKRRKLENRAGSGVIRFVEKDSLWVGERSIILGINIDDYPDSKQETNSSGKSIGEDILSFTPHHAYGTDAGTATYPICKYGWYEGILYFVGSDPKME